MQVLLARDEFLRNASESVEYFFQTICESIEMTLLILRIPEKYIMDGDDDDLMIYFRAF